MRKLPKATHLAPDLGRAHGTTPDRGRPSGHTPADHAHPIHELTPEEKDPPAPGEHRPIEKARPKDTSRGGA